MGARITRLGILWLTAILLSPGAASAQRVLISMTGPGLTPATDLLDVTTGRITRLSGDVTDMARFMPSGELVLRRVSGELRWRARFLASGIEVLLPAGFGQVTSPSYVPLVPHPRDPVLFGIYSDLSNTFRPARLDAQGFVVWDACGARLAFSVDVAPDGESVFVLCEGDVLTPASLVILNSRTGAEMRRLALDARNNAVAQVVVGPGATEFLTLRLSTQSVGWELVRADAVTGQRLTSAPLSPASGGILVANPRRRTRPLIVECLSSGCTTRAVDFETLAMSPQTQAFGPHPGVTFSSDGNEAILSALDVALRVDLVTGATRNHIAAPANGFVVAAWGAEPRAPVAQPALVTGGAVSLTWALPEESTAVTGYRLEVGSQPASSNILTVDVGPSAAFAANGVPAGRYHVRVRAVNANGISAPSNEIVVDVR